jgi:hypothetical protein
MEIGDENNKGKKHAREREGDQGKDEKEYKNDTTKIPGNYGRRKNNKFYCIFVNRKHVKESLNGMSSAYGRRGLSPD